MHKATLCVHCRVLAGDVNEDEVMSGIPTISADRMKQSLMCAETKTSEKEIEEMLSALDLDHDGKVRMDDFVRLLVSPDSGLGGDIAAKRRSGDNDDVNEEDEGENDLDKRHRKCCIL